MVELAMELGGDGCNCGGWLQRGETLRRRRESGSKPGFFRRVGLVRRSGTAPPAFPGALVHAKRLDFFKNYICVLSGGDFLTACIVAGISSKSEKLINDGFTHFKINLRSERGPVQKW